MGSRATQERGKRSTSEQLRRYLESAPHLYPYALEAKFPRVVDKLVSAWPSPEAAAAVFEDLLVDQRGDRQGFPPDVAREIFLLSAAYDKIRALPTTLDDVWAHERTVAAASLDNLGLRATPADMLRSAESGDPANLLLFLHAGMPVDTRDSREWTPLMVAAFNGNEAAAKLLIEHGANPRAHDRAGYTPLHWAALAGYTEVLRLMTHRVDVNVQSRAGLTALLQASAAGHVAAAQMLLEAGADPNIATAEGWTPLHKAVANRHPNVVQLLLAAGASIFARHDTGATPLSLGESGKRADILKMLRSSQIVC
jgi:uncharacterized protein